MEFNVTIKWKREAVGTEEIDFDSLPEQSKRYIIQYGLDQTSNDAGASAETEEDKVAAATRRLESLKAGVVPTGGGGGDPVVSRMRKLARKAIGDAVKAKGMKLEDIDKDKFKALVEQHMETNKTGLRKSAEAAIAAERQVQVQVDLGDLSL